MMGIATLFLFVAFVLALLAGINVALHPRVSHGWLGLAFYFASLLVSARF